MKKVNKIDLDILSLKTGGKALDIGCSYGDQAMKIAKQGIRVYGIDSSKDYIKKFKQSAKKNNLDCTPVLGDATRLPFDSNFFDAVIATEVLEHIPNFKKAIKESYRVLKPGGYACIAVPTGLSENIFKFLHPFWQEDSGHVNFFLKRKITRILEEIGFRIEKIEKQNFEWALFWLIHSFLKTRFDDTGTPKENELISEKYFRLWDYLRKFRVSNLVLWIGNMIFPKSYYIYVRK